MNREVKKKEVGGTKRLKCSCSSEYQDTTIGKGQRIHNQTDEGWRCTVCGNEKES